jgi:hypothetical protein
MVRVQAETQFDQAACAVRGDRADDGIGEWREAVARALQVERVAKVGRGIHQGAVEIEQDDTNRSGIV